MNTSNGAEERPLSQLLSEMSNDLSTLFRKEVELARTEIKEEVSKASKAGGMFAGTAIAGYLALLLLSMAAAWGLAEVVPPGVAFAIVGVVHLIVASVLFSAARKQLADLNPVPQQTVTTVKQDIETARTSIAAGAHGLHGSHDSQPAYGTGVSPSYGTWYRQSQSS